MEFQSKEKSAIFNPPAQCGISRIIALWIFLAAFFVIWTTWAALLVLYPEQLKNVYLQNAVRLIVWVVTTFAFVRYLEGGSVLTRLGFIANASRGIRLGLMTSLVLAPMLYFLRHGFRSVEFSWPTLNTCLGPILAAPVAEEILFRGLVFRKLRERWGTLSGLLVSSILLELIHLPYWWLSGAKSGSDLVLALVEIAGIGALLCGLFRWTGSLWTPLIYHMINNFMTSSFR